ncbi:MAG TPA: peptidylprolyl isomerase [Candidatus Choladocola avistercoris]|nr:peptidylprolyl isomerase [Candidatus Choladocola avistercoris]
MKNNYRCAAAVLAAVLGVSLGGCGNTRIVLTTGLAADELFRIGKVSCRISEALVYLNNQKNQYENVYGVEVWDHDFGGITLEEYLKNQVISQLAQVKSMVLLAGEQEITLSEEELSLAEQAAAEYFGTLSEEEIALLEADQEDLTKMYEDYCLSEKAYDQIMEAVSVEISDDEARIIQIQQILVPEEHLAEELKSRLDEGEEFETLAANYSKASQITVAIARGDMDEVYEETAFNLDNNEISDVFAGDDGYYILKCTNTYMEEESEENKRQLEQARKEEGFREAYDELMTDTLSEYQEKLWKKVSLSDYEAVETDSFFEIYRNYFPEQ